MRKSTRIVKKLLALFLVVLMSIESFGALVSDNDGSAFITKGEFDSLKLSFQSQIDNYNTSIDSKIDGAIAAYLSGIQVKKKLQLEPLVSNYDEIFWTDTFLVKYQKKKWYDEATGTILNNSTVLTSDPVWGCPPKERFHTLNAGLYKLSMRGTAVGNADEYYSQQVGFLVDWKGNYASDFTQAPFTNQNNSSTAHLIGFGAPHYALLQQQTDSTYKLYNVYREFAASNVDWLGLGTTEKLSGTWTNLRGTVQTSTLDVSDDAYKLNWTTTTGGSFITTFTKNAQEISVSEHAPWNVNTQTASSPAKTSTGASGANNSLVNDYYWQSAPGGCGTMKNYLDKSLFGNIGASDTINVLYQALNGVYDKVLGTFNDAATVVELKDISATDTNKLKLQVERGDNIWIKIAPQNKSNETSNSNDRVIKMKNLKIELEVGEEL